MFERLIFARLARRRRNDGLVVLARPSTRQKPLLVVATARASASFRRPQCASASWPTLLHRRRRTPHPRCPVSGQRRRSASRRAASGGASASSRASSAHHSRLQPPRESHGTFSEVAGTRPCGASSATGVTRVSVCQLLPEAVFEVLWDEAATPAASRLGHVLGSFQHTWSDCDASPAN